MLLVSLHHSGIVLVTSYIPPCGHHLERCVCNYDNGCQITFQPSVNHDGESVPLSTVFHPPVPVSDFMSPPNTPLDNLGLDAVKKHVGFSTLTDWVFCCCVHGQSVTVLLDGSHGAWLHFRRAKLGLCLAQLCAKYRLVSATLTPYHWYWKINKIASHKVKFWYKGSSWSCTCPPTLNWHCGHPIS